VRLAREFEERRRASREADSRELRGSLAGPNTFDMETSNTVRYGTQEMRILALLKGRQGQWVGLPEILALGIAQYNARLFSLRRKGFIIENRVEHTPHGVHSWFRLLDSPPVSAPAPPKPSQVWADRPRLTGLPLFDLGVRP
jgi:hypothetical protein